MTFRPSLRLVLAAITLSVVLLVHESRQILAQDAPPPGPADLIILNAKIWTGVTPAVKAAQAQAADKNEAGNGSRVEGKPAEAAPEDSKPVEPPAIKEPTALAVVGGRIVAVGSDEEIQRHIGPHTRIIRGNGMRVIPGLTDAHTHIISGGLQFDRINLRDTSNREHFVRLIVDAAKDKKSGEWLLGGRYSTESWEKPEPPRAAWIDEATKDVPVFLTRMDGHQALANSAALKIAGIDKSGPPDPVGGEIERDPKTKEPTGILKESAMGLVSKHIPPTTPEQKFSALKKAMRYANNLGVTSVHDMCGWDDLPIFARAAKEGALRVRITAYVTSTDWKGEADKVLAAAKEMNGPTLKIAGFKGYMDGSLGSRTAYMREPYTDAGAESLYPRGQLSAFAHDQERFLEHVLAADAKKLQLAVHAIGDEANHLLLNAYEEAARRNGKRDSRHRVEHTQHLIPADVQRFASLGVVASMQPYHKADDARYAVKALGWDRMKASYAFRGLVDAGALLAFGSDWPVVTLNPFSGMDTAVNATTLEHDVWLPQHSLKMEEALRAYTAWAARAGHNEADVGTIEPGKFADLVLLTADPLAMTPEEIVKAKPAFVLLGGQVMVGPGAPKD